MTPQDWAARRAPGLDDFAAIAEHAYQTLPSVFRERCKGVLIRIEDFPDDDTLTEMVCETPFDLLGLFQGLGLAQQGFGPETGQVPNIVWLYRRPILDYWAEHDETLGHVIAHVLIHELGHHLGLSDEDMEAIENAAR